MPADSACLEQRGCREKERGRIRHWKEPLSPVSCSPNLYDWGRGLLRGKEFRVHGNADGFVPP